MCPKYRGWDLVKGILLVPQGDPVAMAIVPGLTVAMFMVNGLYTLIWQINIVGC